MNISSLKKKRPPMWIILGMHQKRNALIIFVMYIFSSSKRTLYFYKQIRESFISFSGFEPHLLLFSSFWSTLVVSEQVAYIVDQKKGRNLPPFLPKVSTRLKAGGNCLFQYFCNKSELTSCLDNQWQILVNFRKFGNTWERCDLIENCRIQVRGAK